MLDPEKERLIIILIQTISKTYFYLSSRDGTKIVYKSDAGGNYDIWTMGSDGTNAARLTNTPEDEGHPHFSPDGSKIVFWSEITGTDMSG